MTDNTKTFLRQNALFYLTGLAVILGIKLFYSRAGCNELRWILGPTAGWAGLLGGISFEWNPQKGYVNHALRFLIAPSCSGIRFLIITFSMLFFSFLHRAKTMAQKSFHLAASLIFSWFYTFFINGIRIVSAIYIPQFLSKTLHYGSWLTPERLHTLIGTVTYAAALFLLYSAAGSLSEKTRQSFYPAAGQPSVFDMQSESGPARTIFKGICLQNMKKVLPPACWYLFFVLFIPFLNRAFQREGAAFMEYTFMITAVCLILLLLSCLISVLLDYCRHL